MDDISGAFESRKLSKLDLGNTLPMAGSVLTSKEIWASGSISKTRPPTSCDFGIDKWLNDDGYRGLVQLVFLHNCPLGISRESLVAMRREVP